MVEMKNPIKEADAHPGVNHLSMWRTDLAYFWVINREGRLQDDMHYHDNDDHVFMLLKSGEAYQLCNTGNGRMLLLGAGNSGVDGKPRTRVPKIPSHIPVTDPIVA